MEDIALETAKMETFFKEMGDYMAPIPDAVIANIAAQAGLETSDPRVLKIVNVAAQKFISSVLDDCKVASGNRANKQSGKKTSKILQLSDLKKALEVNGYNVSRPEYIVSVPVKN